MPYSSADLGSSSGRTGHWWKQSITTTPMTMKQRMKQSHRKARKPIERVACGVRCRDAVACLARTGPECCRLGVSRRLSLGYQSQSRLFLAGARELDFLFHCRLSHPGSKLRRPDADAPNSTHITFTRCQRVLVEGLRVPQIGVTRNPAYRCIHGLSPDMKCRMCGTARLRPSTWASCPKGDVQMQKSLDLDSAQSTL